MRRRILISAYACEPGKGSEQGVGWNWVLQLARYSDVDVITRSNNQPVIEAVQLPKSGGRITFHYYDLPDMVRRLKRKERGLYFYYFLWQMGAFFLARRLVAQQKFDYVFSLTLGSIWMPTFMHRLNVPFIFGPIGGGEAVPRAFLSEMKPKPRMIQKFRYILFQFMRFNPSLQARFRRATLILTRTKDTARLVPDRYGAKTVTALETAVAENVLKAFAPTDAAQMPSGEPRALRVIYTGRLITIKNVSLALRAVAHAVAQGVDLRFSIIGHGPERRALETLAQDLGIEGRVTFHGLLPQEEVFKALRHADIYLFPSLKEGGVWSLMEAMAASLAVICLDTSGMSIITDPECAIRVSPASPKVALTGMGEALVSFAQNPTRMREMGQAGRKRIETEFRWSAKGDFANDLFLSLETPRLETPSADKDTPAPK